MRLALRQTGARLRNRSKSPRKFRCAVIDIGSNSVRLVVYDVKGVALTPRINEKVMAGLGRDLRQTGKLSPEGVEMALSAMRRYDAILTALGIKEVYTIATAAIRDASDGDAFVQRAYYETGLSIRVLSGADEARFAANGVLLGVQDADCIVGDLGGASLELVNLDHGQIGTGETYPLGPLVLQNSINGKPVKRANAAIEAVLQGAPAFACGKETFVAVGGAWRAFARIHMALNSYPLRILHGYRMSREDVAYLGDRIEQGDPEISGLIESEAGKRAETLPYASAVLKKCIQMGGFQSLFISAYGLREGLVYDALPTWVKQTDPLIAGIQSMESGNESSVDFGDALHTFLESVLSTLQPVFETPEREARLWYAATQLADIGASLHPDHRADIAHDLTLRGPYAGEDHVGRTFLAHAIGSRYQRKYKPSDSARSILTSEQTDRARLLGVLMRLGAVFCGRSAPVLKFASLSLDEDSLTLTVKNGKESLISDVVERRLAHAAQLLGRVPQTA